MTEGAEIDDRDVWKHDPLALAMARVRAHARMIHRALIDPWCEPLLDRLMRALTR